MPKGTRLLAKEVRDWLPVKADISKRQALAALGTVVYAVRLDGGVIKIGCTSNLNNRLDTLRTHNRSETAEVLAFKVGTVEDEQDLHALLVDHRHHGHEYYNPTAEVLEVVNEMREAFGLSPVAA